jgi:hypothetical protein
MRWFIEIYLADTDVGRCFRLMKKKSCGRDVV